MSRSAISCSRVSPADSQVRAAYTSTPSALCAHPLELQLDGWLLITDRRVLPKQWVRAIPLSTAAINEGGGSARHVPWGPHQLVNSPRLSPFARPVTQRASFSLSCGGLGDLPTISATRIM